VAGRIFRHRGRLLCHDLRWSARGGAGAGLPCGPYDRRCDASQIGLSLRNAPPQPIDRAAHDARQHARQRRALARGELPAVAIGIAGREITSQIWK
jgi:hypothetical protein